MKSWLLAACGLTISGSLLVAAESIPIRTPGLPPSSLDAECCLIEDWGAVRVRLSGDRIVDGTARLQLVQSDEGIPVARATADRGGVRLTTSVYRAPIFPAGVDVLEVQIDEIQGQACELTLVLELPPGTAAGSRSVSLGGRTVLVLPEEVVNDQPLRMGLRRSGDQLARLGQPWEGMRPRLPEHSRGPGRRADRLSLQRATPE